VFNSLVSITNVSGRDVHTYLTRIPPTVVASCGGGWTLHAWIGMTNNLPRHPVSVTERYLVMNDTHFIFVVYSFTLFPSD